MLKLKHDALKHGIKREALAIPLAENAFEYLSGADEEPYYFDTGFYELADWWRTRWMLPRSLRSSGWRDWSKKDTFISMIPLA